MRSRAPACRPDSRGTWGTREIEAAIGGAAIRQSTVTICSWTHMTVVGTMCYGDSTSKRSAGPGQSRLSLASSKRGPPGTLLLWASSSTLLRLRSSLQGASVRCRQRESSAAASSTTPRPLGNQLEQPPAGKQAFIQILPAQVEAGWLSLRQRLCFVSRL